MKKNILVFLGFSFLIVETQAQTVIDIDGNVYNTIAIGTQVWTQENLKTSRFNNGDVIGTTSIAINNDPSSIYQWPYNEDSLNTSIYGRLYTWYSVTDSRNVCPVGWHVPTESEFTTLANFLGGDSIAGDKMKETGTAHWLSTYSTVTNSSGFTGLPGGMRGNTSGFSNLNILGGFWSSTQMGFDDSFKRGVKFGLHSSNYQKSALVQSAALGSCGFSVRCISDLTADTENVFPEDRILIFPNPTTDQINISLDGMKDVNASVYDLAGNLIFQRLLTNEMSVVDLHVLQAGVYIIRIVGADFCLERKLIKQ